METHCRLKWSGKFEAHLWDNASQVEGRKRKGKHGMFCSAMLICNLIYTMEGNCRI